MKSVSVKPDPREDRINQERLFHTDHGFRPRHLLNRWPFYHPQRNVYAWHLVQRCLTPVLKNLGCTRQSRVLLAPSGWGGDIPYILPLTRKVVGVDVSYEALSKNDPSTLRVETDIKYLPFDGSRFDFVIVSGFLHHVASEDGGYEPYLDIYYGLLKPSGWLVVIEPSWFYPMLWITFPLRRFIFGEITGQLPYEGPISPLRLKKLMLAHRFTKILVRATSFCHPRFPLPLSKTFALFQDSLSTVPILRYCGFFVLVAGRKE